MPKFFVCTPGAMGGCMIIFVCATAAEALAFTAQHVDDLELYIYERQDNLQGRSPEAAVRDA